MTGEGRQIEVAPARLAGWVRRFTERHGDVDSVLSDEVVRLDAGDGSWAELHVPWPPLPAAEPADPLHALVMHAQSRRRLALLLVRKGGFAVGLLEGEQWVSTKVGSRHVQGRTKAGGWSQQRYARRRAAQAKDAYAAAADAAAVMFLPVLEGLDGLVPGGDRRAVDEVLSDPRLHPMAALARGCFLAVPDPRRRVLDDAAERARAVVVRVHDVTR